MLSLFKTKRLGVVALGALALGGCASAPDVSPIPTFADCRAAAEYYTRQVGTVLRDPVGFAPNRVIAPNAMITMDHNPGRLNIYITNDRIITDARCG